MKTIRLGATALEVSDLLKENLALYTQYTRT